MRRQIEFLPIALLMLAGCSTNELAELVPASESKTVISASIEQGANTRVTLDDDNALLWHSGDAITLFDDEGNSETYTLTEASDGKASGAFEGDALQGNLVGAAYPAADNPRLVGNKLTMTLPNVIEYAADGNISVPMYAASTDASNIEFKQLAGLLKVEVKNLPIGSTSVTVTADQYICGTFVVPDVTASGAILTPDGATDLSKTVTINLPSATTEISDIIVYIPLPAQTYGSIQINKTEWTDKTVERAMLYSSTIIFPNLTGIWGCTEYKEDNSVLAESTFTFTSDRKGTTTNGWIGDENTIGSWNSCTDGSIGIVFDRTIGSTSPNMLYLNITGDVNNLSIPTRIEGTSIRKRYAYNSGNEYINTYKVILTRQAP